MFAACFLSFSTGLLSLSLEILWVRLFSFTNHSLPQAFAFVLIFYLIGIAIGAHIGKRMCESPRNLWKTSGLILVISSASDYISPWIYAISSQYWCQLLIGACMISITALLKAIIFPVAHHLGTLQLTKNIGRNVSRVYVANILGATLGPILTGVFLLALFTTQQCFFICAGLTFLVAMYCWINEICPAILTTSVMLGMIFTFTVLMINRDLLLSTIAGTEGQIRRIVENQYGIVITYHSQEGGDLVSGGNVYDGRTNLDPIVNSNSINRVIILSALQQKPTNVLIIGLSIGTWLKLVTAFPGVENIDVVEINPGYLQLIDDYPRQKSGLQDPRVHLYIDDGRRWLKAHPDNHYDLIIMNTTYYWRAYTSNLLSQEFLQLVKKHMNPGAIMAFNTTGSPDTLKTTPTVFKHAYLYQNFIIAADFDWRHLLHQPAAIKKLADLHLDGKTLYPAGSEEVIKAQLNIPTESLETAEPYFNARGRRLEVITDENLITEYKYGERLS